jgi:hypothetical protein
VANGNVRVVSKMFQCCNQTKVLGNVICSMTPKITLLGELFYHFCYVVEDNVTPPGPRFESHEAKRGCIAVGLIGR